MGTIHIFFDSIIALGLLLSATGAFLLFHLLKKETGYFSSLKKTLSVLLAVTIAIFLTLAYGSFIEPRIIIERHEQLVLPGIETPFTIALIADFQTGPYKRTGFVERVATRLLEDQPDIVLIAGDQIDNSGGTDREISFLEPLRAVAQEIPTFAVHGNHEYGIVARNPEPTQSSPSKAEKTKSFMETLGIKYPQNELMEITIHDQALYIFGSDSWWSGNADFTPLLNRENLDIPTIVLNHNPAATYEVSQYGVELLLSGHTHGGQIRLPFLGSIVRSDDSFPESWDKGWYSYNGLTAYTTSGLGESGTRARLFNPPEIVYFKIQ